MTNEFGEQPSDLDVAIEKHFKRFKDYPATFAYSHVSDEELVDLINKAIKDGKPLIENNPPGTLV